MTLNELYSWERTGKSEKSVEYDPRSSFRRDFDRIVFSSAFRRLQNKTQVFPLPGNVFVHNRLTHSLEVASVGRSLGSMMGEFICTKYSDSLSDQSKNFYTYHLHEVIAAACLCHDIGNPSFGHSGEDAIADYFIKNENSLRHNFKQEEWSDFVNFEGNANAIRCLVGEQSGKVAGGLGLTFSTLSAIVKYPCESLARDKNKLHRKKFGFFQSESDIFKQLVSSTKMKKDTSNEYFSYFRHPFVWLVETADDICYNVIDLEDAHRLRIIDHADCRDTLLKLIEALEHDSIVRIKKRLEDIHDKNDRIAFLRAKSINALINRSMDLIKGNFDRILEGTLDSSIYELIRVEASAFESLQYISEFSVKNIYNHRSVVEIENAGYHVLYRLLDHFVPPILSKNRRKAEIKAVELIPTQFLYEQESDYRKVLGVIEYISGMTDNYAVDLYKKIHGISMGMGSIL